MRNVATPPQDSSPTLLTRRQVAEILCTSVRTVDRRIKEGWIDAKRTGPNSVRIPVEAVEYFLETYNRRYAKDLGGRYA